MGGEKCGETGARSSNILNGPCGSWLRDLRGSLRTSPASSLELSSFLVFSDNVAFRDNGEDGEDVFPSTPSLDPSSCLVSNWVEEVDDDDGEEVHSSSSDSLSFAYSCNHFFLVAIFS
jgi:hypothetical protein